MSEKHTEPDAIVGELIARHPEVAQVFLAHRMACVGCDLSGFVTLVDAAQVYGVPLASLLNEIETAAGTSTAAAE